MKVSLKTGISFGLTSGVITTLGLMVGLNASTHSKAAVIGGILTIAVADAFSDALGIHVSQEAQKETSTKAVWESTLSTLVSKFAVALTETAQEVKQRIIITYNLEDQVKLTHNGMILEDKILMNSLELKENDFFYVFDKSMKKPLKLRLTIS